MDAADEVSDDDYKFEFLNRKKSKFFQTNRRTKKIKNRQKKQTLIVNWFVIYGVSGGGNGSSLVEVSEFEPLQLICFLFFSKL